MKLFGKRKAIGEYVEEWAATPGAVLADVRDPEEFAAGHIPGAVNLPLSALGSIPVKRDTPLYLYCLRGTRSLRAAALLKRSGYTNVRSIGGIRNWHGTPER